MQGNTEMLAALSQRLQRHPDDVPFVVGWLAAYLSVEELQHLFDLLDELHRATPSGGLQGLLEERWARPPKSTP